MSQASGVGTLTSAVPADRASVDFTERRARRRVQATSAAGSLRRHPRNARRTASSASSSERPSDRTDET